MRIKYFLLLAVVFFVSISVQGRYASAGTVTLGQWLKSVAYKLRAVSNEDRQTQTAVVGVKGDEDENGEELYWKDTGIKEDEVKRFKVAVAYAGQGKKEEAIKSLEGFIKDYPKSPFAKDAKAGIEAIRAEGGK